MSINYDELVYTNEHLFVLDGIPFTGDAVELFPNGIVRCHFKFLNGSEHGVVEEFFSSGARKSCTPYSHGSVHGRVIEWYSGGAVRVESDVEFGIQIRSREFDESGCLIKEYVRPEDDKIMEVVKRRRANEAM